MPAKLCYIAYTVGYFLQQYHKHDEDTSMLYFTQHYLPFLGPFLGTIFMIQWAIIDKKRGTKIVVIIASMLLQAAAISLDVYNTITNPQSFQAIAIFTGITIAFVLFSPMIVKSIEKIVSKKEAAV
jgi:hypothetical protein